MKVAISSILAPVRRLLRRADQPRRLAGMAQDQWLRTARGAVEVRPLGSLAEYRRLLARQAAGDAIDMNRVVRPGIVGYAASARQPWGVVQGAGRYEKLPGNGYFDAFIDAAAPLPPGAIVVAQGVPGELVAAANTLSSRGASGANPELVEILTEGRVFRRALFPARGVSASTSQVLHELGRLEASLSQTLGKAGLQRRLGSRYADLAPVERLARLKQLAG
ncbi:MAG: hypothetical protein VKP62_04005 [Candidatus Sericytochromatia bacterium]|nr:hypothetical protein [Candidatus Sericytochromatia bacterium]